MDCIFCQIASGKIPSDIVYQDEEVIVFPDINPKAPTHLLIIPKKHIPSLAHVTEAELPLIGHMVNIANRLAKEKGMSERGYRLVVNCGEEAGQIIDHLHMHLLGGQKLPDAP